MLFLFSEIGCGLRLHIFIHCFILILKLMYYFVAVLHFGSLLVNSERLKYNSINLCSINRQIPADELMLPAHTERNLLDYLPRYVPTVVSAVRAAELRKIQLIQTH